MMATKNKYQRAFKNAKKSLRLRQQRGTITAEERAVLQAQAKQQILVERRLPQRSLDLAAAKARGKDFKVPERCSDECIGARGYFCCCVCGAVNHGAALGILPEQVEHAYMSRAERRERGLLGESDG